MHRKTSFSDLASSISFRTLLSSSTNFCTWDSAASSAVDTCSAVSSDKSRCIFTSSRIFAEVVRFCWSCDTSDAKSSIRPWSLRFVDISSTLSELAFESSCWTLPSFSTNPSTCDNAASSVEDISEAAASAKAFFISKLSDLFST